MFRHATNQRTNIIYFVYAPEYVHWSAGIKILYKLHHAIKTSGREVYLLNHGRSSFRSKWNTSRLVSQLNRERESHTFVAIYTESIIGNPLGIKNRIRWVLNYPGLLGGQRHFDGDYVLSYSSNIASKMKNPDGVIPDSLFIGALSFVEIEELVPTPGGLAPKTYDLVYAQKFRSLGGVPTVPLDNVIEITRFDRKSPNREATLNLVRGARSLHVYENSTMITEAQLCEVPVFCHRNEYFNELIAEVELGDEGTSWNLDKLPKVDSEAIRSRLLNLESTMVARVDAALSKFEQLIDLYGPQEPLAFSAFFTPIQHRVQRFRSLVTNRGMGTAMRFLANFIMRSIKSNSRGG